MCQGHLLESTLYCFRLLEPGFQVERVATLRWTVLHCPQLDKDALVVPLRFRSDNAC
jgi:hypothetical protein